MIEIGLVKPDIPPHPEASRHVIGENIDFDLIELSPLAPLFAVQGSAGRHCVMSCSGGRMLSTQ